MWESIKLPKSGKLFSIFVFEKYPRVLVIKFPSGCTLQLLIKQYVDVGYNF